jgi:hypothetical protein
VSSGAAFDLVRVVGLAPQPLRARLASVGVTPGTGIVAKLTAGPDLIFGDATRMPAKWMAAARVLSAAGARGATYIDLRLPERPAAGGLATTTVIPLAPAGASTGTPTTTGATTTGTTTTGTTSAGTTTTGTTTTAPSTTLTQTTTAPVTPPQTSAPPATQGGATQAPQNPQAQVQSSPQP